MTTTNGQLEIDRAQIERIVRSVLSRLADTVAPKPAHASEQAAGDVGGLVIHDRVVTVETVKHLTETKVVVIADRAILTPAAKDFLKERGVSVRRVSHTQANQHNAKSVGRGEVALVSFACETAIDLGGLIGQLARADVSASKLPDNIAKKDIGGLVQLLSGETATRRLVCFTSEPTLVLCAANRTPKLRAAGANCSCCVREAADSIGANVLVVKPRGKSQHQLVQLVREFANCEANCPQDVTRILAAR